MSNSGKCKDNLIFCAHYGPKVQELLRKINKKLGATEKNKETVMAILV